MKPNQERISAVPTNIITGFLGVGKTSAILHLLSQKPEGERWAVLVNEFGEIGVDGSLMVGLQGRKQANQTESQSVFISEVPGGCMCCASGLPMQIALNLLLEKARPDRLLIEPTGLGHPKEVLELLSTQYYQEILSLQKIITLVDARNIKDSRYSNHKTFNQQIEIADCVIGNKMDLYQGEEKSHLVDYVKQKGSAYAQVLFTEQGQIELSQLEGLTASYPMDSHHHHHHNSQDKPLVADAPMPECGYLKARNEGEGYRSIGWRFSSSKVFNHQKLFNFLSGLGVERMKAAFITDTGKYGYNLAEGTLNEIKLEDCQESRIELISESIDDNLEDALLACVL